MKTSLMKKVLASFVFLVFASLSVFGQNCKYVTDEVDEFTGVHKTITKFELLYNDPSIDLKVAASKIDESIILTLYTVSEDILSFRKGDELMLKLENDEIIKLKNSYDTVSESPGEYWLTYLYYPLNEESIDQLMDNKVVKVRVYTSKSYIEREVKKRRQGYISKVLKCVKK